MATSTLMNHRGAREVDRTELLTVEPPPPTQTWFPIAHRAVLDSVWRTLEGAGFQIRQSRLSLSHGDARGSLAHSIWRHRSTTACRWRSGFATRLTKAFQLASAADNGSSSVTIWRSPPKWWSAKSTLALARNAI